MCVILEHKLDISRVDFLVTSTHQTQEVKPQNKEEGRGERNFFMLHHLH